VTLPTRDGDSVLTLPTFSKWGPELVELTAWSDYLVICGVATDCCVLSTVLGAIDAGKMVTVVTDACAGATTEAHDQAIALMGMLAPMVTLLDAEGIVGVNAERSSATGSFRC
jgi:nicotinamidase-related amidase